MNETEKFAELEQNLLKAYEKNEPSIVVLKSVLALVRLLEEKEVLKYEEYIKSLNEFLNGD